MRHDQRTALDVVYLHFANGTMEHRFDVAPAPDERRVRRLRLHRRDALVAVPKRMQMFRFELGDEGLLCHCGLDHGVAPYIPRHLQACLAVHLPRAKMDCGVKRGNNDIHVFGNLVSIFALSTITCLMKTRGSTLSPLRNAASTSTPRRPHSTGLSSTVIARFSSFTARNAGGTPFMPVTAVLPLRLAALTACMAPSATSSLAV